MHTYTQSKETNSHSSSLFCVKELLQKRKKLYVILPYLLASVNKLRTQCENWKVFLQQIFQ